MADRSITDLTPAQAVGGSDLFLIVQSNTAKKLTGQILENWLVNLADGHGGIQSITKTGSAGTDPVIDTYTIQLSDTGSPSPTFTVTNGKKGDKGDQTYVWIKWAAQNPTMDSQMSDLPDAWIGICVGTASQAPAHYTNYTWYQFKGEKGDTGAGLGSVVWSSNSGGSAQGTAGTSDTYICYSTDSEAISSFVVYNGNDGQGSKGASLPLADGTASAGSAVAYSSEDHVHPLNVASMGAPADLGVADNGSATTYARSDHVHNLPALASTVAPADLGTAAVGSSTALARGDHVHNTPIIHLSGTLSSMPTTISDSKITSDMVLICVYLGAPEALASDLSWATASGSITFSGSLVTNQTTTIEFDLAVVR